MQSKKNESTEGGDGAMLEVDESNQSKVLAPVSDANQLEQRKEYGLRGGSSSRSPGRTTEAKEQQNLNVGDPAGPSRTPKDANLDHNPSSQ